MRGEEFDASITSVIYEENSVSITAFPVIHNLHALWATESTSRA
jgi:ribonuclease Z